MQSTHRKALVVLGMHRSGTSALTRALNLAGSFLPNDILPPVPGDNERGFWEPARLVEADDRALAAAGAAWDSATRIAPSWFAGAGGDAAIAELAGIFEAEFAGHDLFVIKDPRLCRIVPLVRAALQRADIEPGFVLVLRHPAAVAASLAARNAMPPGHAQRLWLRYTLDAERDTRDAARVIVGFDELMADWRATLSRIAAALGATLAAGPGIDERISAFLNPSLVHHDGATREPPAGLVGDAWSALRRLQAGDPSRKAFEELDRVARALDAAEEMLTATSVRREERGERGEESPPPSEARAPLTSRLSPPASPAEPPSSFILHPSSLASSRPGVLARLARRFVAAGLFDPGCYRERNPDVRGSATWHYLLHGRAEGRSPHPLFEPEYYARAAGIAHLPPGRWLDHFVTQGEARGISPHPLVDLRRIARGYDLEGPRPGLLARFARDPRPPCSPHPLFDAAYYLDRYADVAASGTNPLVHYLAHGGTEARQPSRWFDEHYYRAQLAEPIPSGKTALQHYVEAGAARRLSPTPRFDPGFFAACHPEIARDGADLLSACLELNDGRIPQEFAAWDGAPDRPDRAPRAPAPSRDADPQFARWLAGRMLRDLFALPGFWTGLVPRIGFAMAAGGGPQNDYRAALEAARALRRRLPCRTVLLDPAREDGRDAHGLDALIALNGDLDPGRLRNRAPHLIAIGWTRTGDRAAPSPEARYDAYWAATDAAAAVLRERTGRPVDVLPGTAGDDGGERMERHLQRAAEAKANELDSGLPATAGQPGRP